MRFLLALLVLAVSSSAAAAEVPEKWHASMQEQLLRGQKLVQTLTGDIDGDGKAEWIAVGEPTSPMSRYVSVALFRPAEEGEKKSVPPRHLFSQRLELDGVKRAGALVRKVEPIGQAVVLVGASPSRHGDSRFVMQIYGWNGKMFRPLVPEILGWRSQGGFSIEDVDPSTPGDEVVAWNYVRGEHEQLFDQHVYAYKIYRYDGIRWVAPERETLTDGKLSSPAEAAKVAGAKQGDLRRQMPRVAEVP